MNEIEEALREVLRKRIAKRKSQAYDHLHSKAIEAILAAKQKAVPFVMDHIEDRLAEHFHNLAGRFGFNVTSEQVNANRQMIAAKEVYAAAHPDETLPEAIDWRVAGGEVLHQGQCGSCVPVTVIAATSAMTNIVLNDNAVDVFGNINELFTNCGGRCSVGMHPEQALRYMRDVGVGYEHQMPYVDQDVQTYRLKPEVKISNYKVLHGIQEMKQALQRGPIIVGMNVWDSIYNYISGLFVEGIGSEIGAHCALCVGYTPEAMIIQQPWGTSFGMSGFMEYSWNSSITKEHPAYSIELLPRDLPNELQAMIKIPKPTPDLAPTETQPPAAPAVDQESGDSRYETMAFNLTRAVLGELLKNSSRDGARRVVRLLYKMFG